MMQPTGNTSAQMISDLARRRWRVAITLTIAMVFLYFGFIALIAFNKPLLARKVTEGLSLGILLGALVIVASWLLTWAYVRWANTHYDTALAAIGRSEAAGKP
jgi:uncharacterized membrane protein (DUF485 family)